MSAFLHKQFRRGMSIDLKRREYSPEESLKMEKRIKQIKRRQKAVFKDKKTTVDINNPIVVTFKDRNNQGRKNERPPVVIRKSK